MARRRESLLSTASSIFFVFSVILFLYNVILFLYNRINSSTSENKNGNILEIQVLNQK